MPGYGAGMASNLDWLPSELEIVALRIARADECAYAIAQLAGQWSNDGPIVLDQTRAGDRFTTTVKAIRPIPPRMGRVRLDDGTVLSYTDLLVALGRTPRTELRAAIGMVSVA